MDSFDSFRGNHLYTGATLILRKTERKEKRWQENIYMVKNRESSWAILDDNSSLFLFFNARIQGVTI